ncbi:hypothetical protein G5I_01696 [Acromyrmex echinatior]|uniref:Uncharacterized protein n=1 Tax=Acromyrmex echinatior TaxID=103372 RepID=F4W8B5_ACREC|nr:hypothetical protein G5I_01696 [Acromyrmex echinatior]
MKKDERPAFHSTFFNALRKTQNKRKGKERRWRTDDGDMDERETRGKAKRLKTGPDLEALEGDIPDSCRRVWIILGPLLARGPPKNNGPNQNQIYSPIVCRDDVEKARNFLRLLTALVGSIRASAISLAADKNLPFDSMSGRSPLICVASDRVGKFKPRPSVSRVLTAADE